MGADKAFENLRVTWLTFRKINVELHKIGLKIENCVDCTNYH